MAAAEAVISELRDEAGAPSADTEAVQLISYNAGGKFKTAIAIETWIELLAFRERSFDIAWITEVDFSKKKRKE